MPNIITKIFKPKKQPEPKQQETTRAEILTGDSAVFTPFSGNAYANDIYRGAVDAIARNAAKLKGTHIIKTNAGRERGTTSLDRLLQVRLNPYMSTFDMLYRMVTHYYLYNNAFAMLQEDDRGSLTAIFPLKPSSMEFVTDGLGQLYCKFFFNNGKDYIIPYSEVIHLRRNYNDNDLLGDPNTALGAALELAHTQNEGIIKGIKNGASIKGILKSSQNISSDLLKKSKEDFINDYMRMDNNGGVAALDVKFDYVPLEQKPYAIDEKQQQSCKDKIYNYLGITEKIVSSSYNEHEWAAFYESVIEPIAIQLSLEFTEKIFTQREQAFGNSVLFEANRLQFASTTTKANLIKEIMPMGLLSINQALEILNMPSIPDGDKRIVSLNYINTDKADQYQLGKEQKTYEGNTSL